jgi:hypothetical protein
MGLRPKCGFVGRRNPGGADFWPQDDDSGESLTHGRRKILRPTLKSGEGFWPQDGGLQILRSGFPIANREQLCFKTSPEGATFHTPG